ncbi:serpin family protein [Streptomyces chiangmaiensis]|uniref:Serpin family protein n=1 Tax=Streptomyces chiangmaiensis TaxID=766497 RepID=A0ABU7FA69_9ACTN|nr:serpin family protein [Streptomyces chiangmaiensis]MED7821087.1 serpin family protein [Streptomyces chiangmaiensis]
MRVTRATAEAVNGLTARWAGVVEGGTVLSAVGVWPLLAFLADGAAGDARAELADAVGLSADRAAPAARELLGALGAMRGLDAALGLWTKRTLELRAEWEEELPAETHGVLTDDLDTDRGALDAWARKQTGGLVDRVPVALEEDTELVLASALALRTEWLRPFEEWPLTPEHGPWRHRTLLGLRRQSVLLDRVALADTPEGPVTELKVLGTNGIDVHLLLGEERMTPAGVLRAGVDVLLGRYPSVPGTRLPFGEVGPGLRVRRRRCETPQPPRLDVTTVAYDMTAHHDLLDRHRLFGLTAASDSTRGHFPGISGFPLAIGSAGQSVTARFGALGFRAAAVTAFGAVPGGAMPERRHVTTTVEAVFDRPFGFLAVHRTSRLVLAAGWVTDPLPFPEYEEEYEDHEDHEEEYAPGTDATHT